MRAFDILIVGLGPTGATLAGLLGQRGLRVAAFDRLPGLFPLPRAIGLDHEAMRIAQELRIADRLAPHVAPYRPSEYRGMRGQPIQRLDATPAPHRLGWAPNYVFEQPAFERILRARLAELPDVHCTTAAAVVAVGQDGDHAWADVVLPGDRRATRHRAAWLVACDGGASPVRKQLGVALEDLGFDEPWLVVDALVSDAKLAELPQTQVQYCVAERPCSYVVGVGRHRRWEIMLQPGDSLATDYPPERLWPLLSRWIGPGDAELRRAAAYRFHGLVAHQWRAGRILLAGDAAHMTPPFLAQGMVQGMRDAANLAWKLERVVRGRSSPALLDTYATERRPHVVSTTRTAMALGRVICERDPARAHERDARLLAEQGGQVVTRLRQDLIPGLAAGPLIDTSPGAGGLMPQPVVAGTDPGARLDDLTGACVRVVASAPLDGAMRAALVDALRPLDGRLVQLGRAPAVGRDDGVIAIDERDPVLDPWLAGLARGFAIVRPDHYVHGTARTVAGALQRLASLRAALA